MKRHCFRAIIICLVIGVLSSNIFVNASAESLIAEKQKTVLLGFNDYGWCSFAYYIKYNENYTSQTNVNAFDKRSEYFSVTTSRSDPPCDVFMSPNIDHRLASGANLCRHTVQIDTAILPDCFAAGFYSNFDNESMAKNTTITGHCGFGIAGADMVLPYSTTLELALKTQ